MKSGFPAQRTNLIASLLALFIASLGVAAGLFYCQRLEHRFIHALASDFTDPKLQGIALQREAFAQPDLLVLYGSSELAKEMPNNATHFFQDYPTGFRAFPVGKPGTTSLAVLQKLAAVGESVKGQKLAYSISPGWFFTENFDPKYYEGNFSEVQATEFAFSSPLSSELKRDIARRMLEYPKTLEPNWLLQVAVKGLAGETAWERAAYSAVWPLGKLENYVMSAQDHVEAAIRILDEDEAMNPTPRRSARVVNWSELFKRATQVASAPAIQAKRNEVIRKHLPKASRDKTLTQTIAHAKEWTDLELLLRTMKELDAKPLLLSMPVEDIRLEASGATASTREAYVQRMDAMARQYEYPLLSFRDHESDPAFLVDFLDHLSDQGWLYYNKALDDFFHGRISRL